MTVFVAALLVSLAPHPSLSAPFEAAFKIRKVEGQCSICREPPATPVPAEAGQAYAYGTRVTTAPLTSVQLEFSARNTFTVLTNSPASFIVKQDPADPKLKTIELHAGRMDIALEENFREHNALNVETPAAVCSAIGCRFQANCVAESDAIVASFLVHEGKVKVFAPNFEIPLMEKDDGVSVSHARDHTYTRVRNTKGEFSLNIRDSDGNPKIVEMKAGCVVKISRKVADSGDLQLITILVVTNMSGRIDESIHFTEKLDPAVWPVVRDTTTAVTPTTTTTVPSPTPVGRR
jgi:hypothetical protein